jgi:hypothetical protein
MQRRIVDLSALIETQRVGRFAWSLLGWTFVCMLLDGFEFAGISFVVPAVAREWHVEVGSFGSVLGIGVLLPESVRFLTLHERGWGELARVIRSMSPHIDVPADARFVIHEDARVQHFTPDLLFAGSLLFITPLLWLF